MRLLPEIMHLHIPGCGLLLVQAEKAQRSKAGGTAVQAAPTTSGACCHYTGRPARHMPCRSQRIDLYYYYCA